MISILALGLALASVTSLSIFSMMLKNAKEKMMFTSSAIIGANLIIFLTFALGQLWQGNTLAHTTSDFVSLLGKDTSFYVLKSCFFFIQSSILAYLLSLHPLSSVMLILQLGVLVTSIQYYFLGDILQSYQIVGIGIVCVGSIISGFKKFTYPNIFKPLASISLSLYGLGLLKVLFHSVNKSFLFIATNKTPETLAFHKALDSMPLVQDFPTVFYTTLDYRIGLTPFMIFGFLIYMGIFYRVSPPKLWSYFTSHTLLVCIGTLSYFSFLYLYVTAFGMVENKTLMIALNKFQIPFTLIGAAMFLKEKISIPNIVGACLIIGGGILSIL